MFIPLQNRTLSVSGEALPTHGGEPLLIARRLSGTEALGKLYEYALDVETIDSPYVTRWDAEDRVVPDKLIGRSVTITIEFEGNGTFVPGSPGRTGGANRGAGTRTISGIVTDVRYTGNDARRLFFRFIVRPWLWLADQNCDNRVFQNANVVDITREVLQRGYPFPFELRLAAPCLRPDYPRRDFVRQYWQSDFDFLSRLWREWGIYFFFDGPTLVLCDSPGSHLGHDNAYDTIRFHAQDGAHIDEEHIQRLAVSRKLTAGKVDLVDYDYTRSRAGFLASSSLHSECVSDNAAHYQWGDYAQPLAGAMGLSGRPNNYESEAEYLASVRVDALRCRGQRLKGRGNLRGLTTGKTFRLTDHPLRACNAEYLVVSTTLDIRNIGETSQSIGRDASYQCKTDFVLQPANTFFKNRLKKKPRCSGETAVVVCPDKHPIWVDSYARIKVRFLWDRRGHWNPPKHVVNEQDSSCWVRVSSPWQGNGCGFVALPRVGDEVGISYHGGDVDKPYVSDRMVNQFRLPPWELPKNQALAGLQSRSLDGIQTNRIVADDTPSQLQVQMASDHAQSRLVLGYNTHIVRDKGRQQARGEGFELATDAAGVVRARGLLLSTEAREGASAPAKDMGETVRRLTQAREQHENLAQLARQQQAQQPGVDQADVSGAMQAQIEATHGVPKTHETPFPELPTPQMVLASAAGISVTAVGGTHIASQQDHAVTAGRDISLSTLRSLMAAAKGAVSIFAYRLGMKLIAAHGKVEMQAQSDAMDLTALKDVTVTSTDGKVILTAAKEVWIGAGGSYIRINASGIENATPGQILEKCAVWDKPAPASLQLPRLKLPKSSYRSTSRKPMSF